MWRYFVMLCLSLTLLANESFVFSFENIQLTAEQQATPPSEPPLKQESTEITASYQGAFVKMMLTLFALIVLIVLSVWMLRKIAHGRLKQLNYGRVIKVLERRPLSAKTALYLIQVGEKKILIAESHLEVRTLSPIDEVSQLETE